MEVISPKHVNEALDNYEVPGPTQDEQYLPDPRMDGQPVELNQNFLRFVLNFPEELTQLFFSYTGYILDDTTGKYIKDKTCEPMISEQGARQLMTHLKPYFNRVNITTYSDKPSFKLSVILFARSLQTWIECNYKKYNITKSNATLIYVELCDLIKSIKEGNMKGKYREWGRGHQVHENINHDQGREPQRQKRGLFWG